MALSRPGVQGLNPRASPYQLPGGPLGGPFDKRALITTNTNVIHELHTVRQAAIDKYQTKPGRLMSASLGPKNTLINVGENDLVMQVCAPVPETGNERLIEGRAIVFPSFNGWEKPNIPGFNDDDLRRIVRVAGVAVHARLFGDDSNDRSGLTVYVHGSVTIYNRSKHEFHMGDIVRVIYPAVNEEVRKQEMIGMPSCTEHPKDRLEPILVPAHLTDAKTFISEAVNDSFVPSNGALRDITRLLNPQTRSRLDDKTMMSLAYRLDRLWTAYVAITSFLDYYGGSLPVGDAKTMADFTANYNRFAESEAKSPNLISKSMVSVDEDDGRVTIAYPMSEEQSTQKMMNRVFVATKLGLHIQDDNRAMMRPCFNLVEAIIGRTSKHLIRTPEYNKTVDIAQTFMPGSSRVSNVQEGQFAINTLLNLKTFVGQLQNAQGLVNLNQEAQYRATELFYESCIGRCGHHSLPGTRLMLNLRAQ